MKVEISPKDSSIRLTGDKKIYMTQDLAASWTLQKKALREIRGNIIALTIEIEILLDEILIEFFYPDGDKNLRDLFDAHILKDRPIELRRKIQILRSVCNKNSDLKSLGVMELCKNLQRVQDVRDRFAHNTITFVPKGEIPNQTLVPILTCHDTQYILDTEYFDELNNLYNDVRKDLENLLESLVKKIN